MAALTSGIWLAQEHLEQMRADVARRAPEEACGLVAGMNSRTTAVYPTDNTLHSPVRFRVDPQQEVDILLEIEKKGWDLAAIYHSHPAGPPVPSPTDIAEASFPEAAWLIWSPAGGEWRCRAFLIQEKEYLEISIILM